MRAFITMRAALGVHACLLNVVLAQSFPANNRYDANVWMSKLRAAKLGASNFDAIVPPTSNRALTTNSAGHYSSSGTDVKVGIRFFKVESVNTAQASMRLKVWVRMSWKDERLGWSPASFGGLTKAYYRADQSIGSEASEIWLPDLQPYNALGSFVQTLEPSFATASSDGSIFWSRPGSLEILCKFSGLVAFPFDNLKCQFEIGGWALSGGQQGLQMLGSGYEFSSQEVTAGASYQEISIDKVNVSLETYTYPCCPSEPWPVILYTITMKRVWMAYFPLVIFPGILITFLSFAVFLTDTGSADALGYGIGVIVVNLLSNFILVGMLPSCGEMLWVDLFSNLNTGFCCLALAQSSFSIMLENHEDDHLLPLWLYIPLARFAKWLRGRFRKSTVVPSANEPQSALSSLSSEGLIAESVAGVIYRQKYSNHAKQHKSTIKPAGGAKLRPLDTPEEETALESASKLIFYEKVFFKLDEDCSLFISSDECDLLLSYTAIDVDPDVRKAIFSKHDFVEDGKLNRVEFVGMCVDVLWDVPTELIWNAMENMDIARKARVKRNKVYWNGVSAKLDARARYVFPGVYIFLLIWLFNFDLSDKYADATLTTEQQTFSGLGPSTLSTTGVVMLFVYTFLILVVSFATVQLNRFSKRKAAQLQETFKATSRSMAEDMSMQAVRRVSRAEGDQEAASSSSPGSWNPFRRRNMAAINYTAPQ